MPSRTARVLSSPTRRLIQLGVMSALGERLLAVHDALDGAGMPHAIGGAIALGYCVVEPRGTRDLDVNVFVPQERFA